MRDYFVGTAMKGKSMRYLILFSLLLSSLLAGCVTSSDKSSSEVLGYSLGFTGAGGTDGSNAWMIFQIGIKDSAEISGTTYRTAVFNKPNTTFSIRIMDSILSPYQNKPAMRSLMNPPKIEGAVLIDSALIFVQGNCITWDQSRFAEKVPCLPYTRE